MGGGEGVNRHGGLASASWDGVEDVLLAAGIMTKGVDATAVLLHLMLAFYAALLALGVIPEDAESIAVETAHNVWKAHGAEMVHARAMTNLGALVGARAVREEGEKT